jgi:hypothetical protein
MQGSPIPPSPPPESQIKSIREILHIEGGKCSNQISTKFWEVVACGVGGAAVTRVELAVKVWWRE